MSSKPSTDRTVINLTNEELDEATKSILAKGLNFAATPKCILYSDFIRGVEQALRSLPQGTAEEIRQEIAWTLERANPAKYNLPKEEHFALTRLQRNPDIVVLLADKGNATIIMPREMYHQKIGELL
ncbi:hypothetical protein J437_LFUL012553 [Ladona fulva]|uniref:Uncharacterized protein n=1 Tax=Ladona fulva TaxID=123851 RepID=A0A8K0KER6_LADFU|nr:hypothetical protein J437_LFUL012553 [Ladona fulva]